MPRMVFLANGTLSKLYLFGLDLFLAGKTIRSSDILLVTGGLELVDFLGLTWL